MRSFWLTFTISLIVFVALVVSIMKYVVFPRGDSQEKKNKIRIENSSQVNQQSREKSPGISKLSIQTAKKNISSGSDQERDK